MEAILRKEIITSRTLCRTLAVLAFVMFTALGAFVRIPLPFSPVPITLQTLFVLLGGALLGSSLGVLAQLSYIFLGISGLPIFTGAGSGLLYLLGPTGGYLFGFIIAALFLGRFIGFTKNNFLATLGIFCIADFLLLFCGVIWLKFIFAYSFTKLLIIGFIPFILGDLLKILVAVTIYLRLQPRVKQII
jgi:biotin transport system substrate-specific component